MKINWKVRFKNPVFLVQLVLSIFTPIFGYFGLTAQDITTWGTLFDLIKDALSNPYVLSVVGVSVFGLVNDPTTSKLRDSKQAMEYTKPREHKNE